MKWNNIDDKLPEIGTPVLCYDETLYRYPYECYYDVCIFKGEFTHSAWDDEAMESTLQEAYKWPLFENAESGNTRQYTHWQPLPKPPTP